MTTRETILLNYLITKFHKNEKEYISKEDIAKDLKFIYPRYKEKSNDVNSSAYRNIRRDFRSLQFNDEVSLILVSNKNGYKIATKKEAERYLKSEQKKALCMLKKNWVQYKKAKLDGQYNIALEETKAFMETI